MNKKEYLGLFEKTNLFIQEVPSLFHYPYYVGECQTKKLFSSFDPVFSKMFSFKENDYIYWIYDEKEMLEKAKKEFYRRDKDKHYFKNQLRKWKQLEEHYYNICAKIETKEISSLSLAELKRNYLKFKEAYSEEYGMAMVTDQTGIFAENEILAFLSEKFSKDSKKYREVLMKISALVNESFVGKEQYNLYKIALEFGEDKEKLKTQIREHTKKYYWIQNNYLNIQKLNENYFLNRIRNHLNNKRAMQEYCSNYFSTLENNKIEKEKLMDELDSPEKFRIVVEMSEVHGHWQDLRKKANLIGHGYIKEFLDRASELLGISYENLALLTVEEFESVISEEKVDWEEIKKRQKLVGVIYTKDEDFIYVGKEAERFKEILEQKMKIHHVNDFRGNSASVGKVKGIARIVLNPYESDFEDGEILITSMTRPEFVPLIRKSSAIITNEGGMTCHAAIISRELNKPCIVGTKIATKVIKDGDLIEVDANHGVVRILDRITS